jgi:TDG/mug DNA glycosylase family protein
MLRNYPEELRGHQSIETWMGKEYLTLKDLWPEKPKAVVVGINPSPVSVEIGHYYQGTLGIRFFERLKTAGVLPRNATGFLDDVAVQKGVAFTDLVKRPTPRAAVLSRQEMEFGRDRLERELADREAPLVIFVYKKSATQILGDFPGNGLLVGLKIGSASVFVMPAPFEATRTVNTTLGDLRELWHNPGRPLEKPSSPHD